MTVISAHQPAYLPWLGYFHKIALCDIFVVLDDVQFEKNSFTNRNKIKGPNGEFWLTVPVSLKGHTGNHIRQTQINNNIPWMKKHLKSIENNYKKAPFFNRYIPFFHECYGQKWDSISDLTHYMLRWFLDQLCIDVKMYRMSEFSFDCRKTELLVQISKRFEGDIFIFGVLGKDYVDPDIFNKENIQVYFQDYRHPEYPQLYGDFIPNLSILDLLFNCGTDSTEILFDGNINQTDLIKAIKQQHAY